MTTEQQRKMLECAAKACGLIVIGYQGDGLLIASDGCRSGYLWEPTKNAIDTAEMCAKMEIDWMNLQTSVICGDDSREYEEEAYLKSHDNSRLKAWMFAATMVAAKTQGYEP